MKHLLNLLLLTVIICCQGYASGISKWYVQRNAGNECVFFIFSKKIPALENTKAIIKNLEYDFTYAQKNDSVAMLLTLKIKQPVKVQKISIMDGTVAISSVPEIIYVNSVGSKMKYRLRLMMSFEEFCKIFDSTNPYTLILNLEDQKRYYDVMFGYNSKEWADYSKKMRDIIELIKLNTGKK
ncbi:MAG: hypothetical protein K2H39_06225 [Paramuribaculum sp.]|nr:hypothetical protein [Paramuribaculum sp.]